MEMVTLTRTQTYAILAYYEIWGPPTKFRTEEIETEFPRVRNRYKDPGFHGNRSSLSRAMQICCPECKQFAKKLVIWHMERLPGAKDASWWMHPPLKQWLDAHPEAMPDAGIIFDIAVPRELVEFAFVEPELA